MRKKGLRFILDKQKEYEEYAEVVSEWNNIDALLSTAYEDTLDDDHIEDEEFKEIARDTILSYQPFLKELKVYQIKSQEIQKLHLLYIKGIEEYLRSIKLNIRCIEEDSEELERELEQELSKTQDQVEDLDLEFKTKIIELGRKLMSSIVWVEDNS
ncbi:hypothetical protein [Metabacillus idriensis]|uniref:hypothetical protein n=1 Tax=Metabacillus idriensis TaxID=324768 RepID=UPI003D2B17AD